jgi:hypothetical protein
MHSGSKFEEKRDIDYNGFSPLVLHSDSRLALTLIPDATHIRRDYLDYSTTLFPKTRKKLLLREILLHLTITLPLRFFPRELLFSASLLPSPRPR